MRVVREDELWHYGVKGMRKGYRRWTNEDGTLTEAGKKHYGIGDGPDEPNSVDEIKARKTATKIQKAADKVYSQGKVGRALRGQARANALGNKVYKAMDKAEKKYGNGMKARAEYEKAVSDYSRDLSDHIKSNAKDKAMTQQGRDIDNYVFSEVARVGRNLDELRSKAVQEELEVTRKILSKYGDMTLKSLNAVKVNLETKEVGQQTVMDMIDFFAQKRVDMRSAASYAKPSKDKDYSRINYVREFKDYGNNKQGISYEHDGHHNKRKES